MLKQIMTNQNFVLVFVDTELTTGSSGKQVDKDGIAHHNVEGGLTLPTTRSASDQGPSTVRMEENSGGETSQGTY